MHQRHRRILEILQHGALRIRQAAPELGVTEMTLRRDLRELEAQNLILMVKGGAILHPARYEPERSKLLLTAEKFALAEALYEAIMPVDSLYISSGFTALAFARVLSRRNTRRMTVITNFLPAAAALFQTRCQVILPGGELRSTSLDLIGPIAEREIGEFQVEWAVSGCDGALPGYGFYTSDMNLSRLEARSIGIADHVAIISESAKFGRKALTRFAAVREVDLLVTDDRLEAEAADALRREKVKIIQVPLKA
ncbi:DeoR/GlpR family DNA-binding transcription regulator [Victivallis sp. Marseille-Q1083]|uniref:DeoR/GlpR family DNA-binding transcription regulator n=1 Tax=Victivallis sp. Marseille-Q1083 TaxID=2717288 RepID=UPI001589FA03|nr:DeoR/GlpR family DNA-binding transcription regulator [Victivallis sp. Marseille-Q1083]